MNIDIKAQCRGRWSGVLASLGVDPVFLSGKHGDCIKCGDTHKNARWNSKKEYWVCSKCGVTQAVELAMTLTGDNFKNTAALIRGERLVTMEPMKQTDDTAKNKARIDKIRAGLKPINGECAASKYLANRGLSVLPEKDCYFHPGIDYWNDHQKTTMPAMVSIFRNADGKGSTFHVTYLSNDGKKADVESPKKILPVVLPLPGCAIQLFKPEGVLAIAEGVETALAVYQEHSIPVWAAGNASLMESMVIPEAVREVWIYADMDATFTGQKSAYTLARRLSSEKRKVRVQLIQNTAKSIDEFIDTGEKLDFLDALLLMRLDQKARSGSAAPC